MLIPVNYLDGIGEAFRLVNSEHIIYVTGLPDPALAQLQMVNGDAFQTLHTVDYFIDYLNGL